MGAERGHRLVPPPKLLLFEDFGGDWGRYEDALDGVFMRDLAKGNPTFRGKRVGCRKTPEFNKRWAAFWHLIQEGRVEDEREPEMRRCERLPWVRYVIDNCDTDPSIDYWEQRRSGSEMNAMLWLAEEYVVVLGQRADYWLLRTAFCTTRSGRIASYRRELAAWRAAQKG